ncbi:SDR family oxidoreductase [Mycobacterium sp. ACS4331]|uniref:SDR family oxidoreductase n=1 Tax=Mycobacterium sp. ACS4331 TaxID=1834121 RepID=UPI000AA47F34|nr:SDR family oxidoreductase [Mycobacterium sp. ACS4331]
MGIDGKTVAITGASSGIGAATAVHLAARGAAVVLAARRSDRLDDVVQHITDRGGVAVALRTDVRRRADVEHLVDATRRRFGRLDVLFSNAGSMAVSAFDDLRVDDWQQMIEVNLTGVLNGISAALPVFRAQGSGHFIHTASTAAHRIVATQGVYAATKTAVRVLSESLRQEAGPDLRVTVISPGLTDTEGVGKGASQESAQRLRALRADLAMPPDAVARAVGFAIEQPDGVDVGEIVVRPTAQS